MSDSSVQPFFASDLALADNSKISISQVYIHEVQSKNSQTPQRYLNPVNPKSKWNFQ